VAGFNNSIGMPVVFDPRARISNPLYSNRTTREVDGHARTRGPATRINDPLLS
jgi:hypothetical protein